jgi:hypothetical protein
MGFVTPAMYAGLGTVKLVPTVPVRLCRALTRIPIHRDSLGWYKERPAL